ncbi:hypothetical protein D9758_009760 [Tetrapyrgos nigripes]|uniref:Uncharacterized protein n=1 Tax=Tetrapyrgos nigripes TaxID=182062 RepID=A0A8H5GKJ5_9AGAR|nr:hypothetical protein D9758_009760 [Tetrapyrgos nigripes]
MFSCRLRGNLRQRLCTVPAISGCLGVLVEARGLNDLEFSYFYFSSVRIVFFPLNSRWTYLYCSTATLRQQVSGSRGGHMPWPSHFFDETACLASICKHSRHGGGVLGLLPPGRTTVNVIAKDMYLGSISDHISLESRSLFQTSSDLPSSDIPSTQPNSDVSLILALTFGCLLLILDLLLLIILIRIRTRMIKQRMQRRDAENLGSTLGTVTPAAPRMEEEFTTGYRRGGGFYYQGHGPRIQSDFVVDDVEHRQAPFPLSASPTDHEENLDSASVLSASEYSYRSSRIGSFDPKVAELWQNARSRIRSLIGSKSSSDI